MVDSALNAFCLQQTFFQRFSPQFLLRIGDLESAEKVLDKMLSDGMVNEGVLDSILEMSKEIIKRKWVLPFEGMEGLLKGLVERSRSEEAKLVVRGQSDFSNFW
ncbi:hypothetical protein V6N13_143264 [Hibiscus sabdariffa]